MTPADVRAQLVAALQLDLVGPHDGIGDVAETLPQHPSRWYLTGFLVPFDAGESQANDEDAGDDIDGVGERGGTDDDTAPEKAAASKTRFPSSMGLSVLLPTEASQLQVTVEWGDYQPLEQEPNWNGVTINRWNRNRISQMPGCGSLSKRRSPLPSNTKNDGERIFQFPAATACESV